MHCCKSKQEKRINISYILFTWLFNVNVEVWSFMLLFAIIIIIQLDVNGLVFKLNLY